MLVEPRDGSLAQSSDDVLWPGPSSSTRFGDQPDLGPLVRALAEAFIAPASVG